MLICALGDLLLDVVVRLDTPLRVAGAAFVSQVHLLGKLLTRLQFSAHRLTS